MLRGKPFASINDAKYTHIDGNIDNDDPKNHVWLPRKF